MSAGRAAGAPAERPREATQVHTRILRVTLAEPECRAYWEHVDVSVPAEKRADVAFEQRWFGAKSMARVRTLIATLSERFDPFPQALDVLHGWRGMTAATRVFVCHVHLQLSDPMYRAFTGDFLVQHRASGHAAVARDQVERWVRDRWGERWAAVTRLKFAGNLLAAAGEAGLVAGRRDPRPLTWPALSDEGLVYALYVLRDTALAGRLFDNAYLASVGLSGEILAGRLRNIDALSVRKLGDVVDVEWAAPDLRQWAERARGARPA